MLNIYYSDSTVSNTELSRVNHVKLHIFLVKRRKYDKGTYTVEHKY